MASAQDWANKLPPGLNSQQVFERYAADSKWGEFTLADAQQAYLNAGAQRQVEQTEARAREKAVEEQQTETRRRLGPRGFGATVLTSPLGITGPAPGQVRSLLGMA